MLHAVEGCTAGTGLNRQWRPLGQWRPFGLHTPYPGLAALHVRSCAAEKCPPNAKTFLAKNGPKQL